MSVQYLRCCWTLVLPLAQLLESFEYFGKNFLSGESNPCPMIFIIPPCT